MTTISSVLIFLDDYSLSFSSDFYNRSFFSDPKIHLIPIIKRESGRSREKIGCVAPVLDFGQITS